MEKTRLDTGVSENFQVSQEKDEMIIFHGELAETRVTKERSVSWQDVFQGQHRAQDHPKKGEEIKGTLRRDENWRGGSYF